jgi:hypothetical protein
MNFELADKLYVLLEAKKLDEAIALAENELRSIPETDFHKILDRNLLHLTSDLAIYIAEFDQSTSEVLKKKRGFLRSIFSSEEKNKPVALYCEMNGFTINWDRWYIELYSFEKFSPKDWSWLPDFYDSSYDFTITGFEDIQEAFRKEHESDRFNDSNIEKAYQVCELLVILRLQELFREAYKGKADDWAAIPMFVTAHDYDLIYRPN